MRDQPPASPAPSGHDFYRQVLNIFEDAEVPFLVGGAFAMRVHAGIERDTKDFDLMLRPRDVERALEACQKAGFRAGYAFSHWIAKVHHGEHFIDLIYRAGNGLCEVDDGWFANSVKGAVLGRSLPLCPPEEMIWQKAYVMERERFDGADVLHLLRKSAETLDWKRLVARFGEDWRVLLGHLILFGYVYPQERHHLPAELVTSLLDRVRDELTLAHPGEPICRGTLLSRAQYLSDVERWGYRDARQEERIKMTAGELLDWTTAIDRPNRSR